MWNSILEQGGSVQHLDFLTPEEKAAYKTSFEIDQRWLLELAADRTPYHRPGAVAEPVHPGRRREVGPADAPLPRVGAGHQVALLSALQDRCSAPASPAGSRPTTPPKRAKYRTADAPTTTNAWPASNGRCAQWCRGPDAPAGGGTDHCRLRPDAGSASHPRERSRDRRSACRATSHVSPTRRSCSALPAQQGFRPSTCTPQWPDRGRTPARSTCRTTATGSKPRC